VAGPNRLDVLIPLNAKLFRFGRCQPGIGVGMGYQVTEVQKTLAGFDYPGTSENLAEHAKNNGAADDLVDTLRGLGKDDFGGPSAVMKALGQADALGGSSS
jgi:hypothetical protein